MSRQKVPDDKRQRTAQACDYCKRRKQKCNGAKPCLTCTKKFVTCTYLTVGTSGRPDEESGDTTSKRRNTGQAGSFDASASDPGLGPASARGPRTSATGATATGATATGATATNASGASVMSPRSATAPKAETDPAVRPARDVGRVPRQNDTVPSVAVPVKTPGAEDARKAQAQTQTQTQTQVHAASATPATASAAATTDASLEDHTRTSTTSGQEEEAVLEQTTRLLKDQTGRLLYIGDSATLSYLHLLRRIVESIAGSSDFTADPKKYDIVENVVSLPPHVRPPSMLPNRKTADVLVESFFTNTSGLVEIFDRKDFLRDLDACYENPHMASNHFVCLLFLVFAIGLSMATPDPGTSQYQIVQELHTDTAELFFRSAKCMCDPLSGLEDADFWSIQALTLIAIYMLVVSKRNAAFAYHGMAVRSAIALGLHRQEALARFSGSALNARRNIWKSLYTLDRFIAASLGRPSAINEEECTEAALEDAFQVYIPPIYDDRYRHASSAGSANSTGSCANPAFKATESHIQGVNATVRSSRLIGKILRRLYAKRRISSRNTEEIVEKCRSWPKELHESVRWGDEADAARQSSKSARIAALHVNLVYCHSIILLTRPFFLFLIRCDRNGRGRVTAPLRRRTEKFSEVCIAASYHTITMIQHALDNQYLARRNPFIMYYLFAAALVIMSNEFIALIHHPGYNSFAAQAIGIMEYYAKVDAQGFRLLWILRAFQDVIDKQVQRDMTNPAYVAFMDHKRPFHLNFPRTHMDDARDPILAFFATDAVSKTKYAASLEHALNAKQKSRSRTAAHAQGRPYRLLPHMAQGDALDPDHYAASGPAAKLPMARLDPRRSSQSGGLFSSMGSAAASDFSQPGAGSAEPMMTTPSMAHLPGPSPVAHTPGQAHGHSGSGSYMDDSPSLGTHVLPPPLLYSHPPHGLFGSPGTMSVSGGGSVASSSTLGMGMGFNNYSVHGSYGSMLGPLGMMGGGGVGGVGGYYRVDGKTGDEGSDSIGTDNDAFELEDLWDWPTGALQPGSGSMANASLGGGAVDPGLGESDAYGAVASGGVGADATPGDLFMSEGEHTPGGSLKASTGPEKQSGPVPLPPMYPGYGMGLQGMSGPNGGPMMTAPMNVPLYHMADSI